MEVEKFCALRVKLPLTLIGRHESRPQMVPRSRSSVRELLKMSNTTDGKRLTSLEMCTELLCHRCGYDLRAHPPDGKCPECGESVAESRRWAAIPLRPLWRDSDPRWRRRMLAGVWVLVLLPLMDMLNAFGWSDRVPVPAVFEYGGTVRRLSDTLLAEPQLYVYQPLVFCIGLALLFSKERGRRRNPLDWTRRWGVICSYVVLLLSALPVLFIGSLVLTGVSALFLSMPLKYQPGVTGLFVQVSTTYLRYGPYPRAVTAIVHVAFSSIAILLACIALFDALRSSGPRRFAVTLLAPLALFALMYLAQAGGYCLSSGTSSPDIVRYRVYFRPEMLANGIADLFDLPTPHPNPWGSAFMPLLVEAAKWCVVLGIAIWLSIAQLAAWWQRRKANET